jgi:hypothetical protein
MVGLPSGVVSRSRQERDRADSGAVSQSDRSRAVDSPARGRQLRSRAYSDATAGRAELGRPYPARSVPALASLLARLERD